ncbi:MAG: AAA family ATPase, partial ['Waltheria sp.' little leaf phytoplasma]|nr:AAA family ATPase ['Waltheria sp.' little leaf phytoplasma]
CMLLIDEIDAIRGRGRGGDADGWWTAIVTCLLECLDGTTRRKGVIVLGACNVVENLDAAMIRLGRLDRHFEIGLPDETALLGIMRHHMPDADAEALVPAATALAGSTSGADVARIAREARRGARRERRAVTAQDLLDVAMPPDLRPAHLRRLIAVHEAGHAVVGILLGHVPQCLSTVRAGMSNGIKNRPSLMFVIFYF